MTATGRYTDRVLELLVQQATDSLSASEQVELSRLLGQSKQADVQQFEQTTAALLLAGIGEEEPMPDGLKAKLMTQAESFALSLTPRAPVVNIQLPELVKSAKAGQTPGRQPHAQSRWPWIATAASLAIAVAGWWPRIETGQAERQTLTQVLADDATVKREWQPTQDPAASGVTGEVIWNQEAQVGYMRFKGLAANDPRRAQYQLWIFDRSRGEKYPVDGGVFDIPSAPGEIVVPITARLPVRDPTMFAVTLEQAGGVVVSEREHILVLAKVAG